MKSENCSKQESAAANTAPQELGEYRPPQLVQVGRAVDLLQAKFEGGATDHRNRKKQVIVSTKKKPAKKK